MSRKITFLTLFLWLMTVTFPVIAQQKTDTTYTFRFVPQKDMFYVPWNGNDTELARLLECIENNKATILDGKLPLLVDGYCNSLGGEAENLATAKIRANRVKSELITRAKIKEENFITHNHATEGDFVIVRLTVPAKETAAMDAEAEARRRAEAERLATEKRAEQERLAEEQRKAEEARLAAEKAEVEKAAQQNTLANTPSETKITTDYHLSLRANLLRWAILTPDLGVEWRICPSWGIAVNGSWTSWSWNDKDRRYALWEVAPEIRYYMGEKKAWYLGAMFKAGQFNYKISETGKQGASPESLPPDASRTVSAVSLLDVFVTGLRRERDSGMSGSMSMISEFFADGMIPWSPILLSLKVAGLATAASFCAGVAAAWLLARRRSPFSAVLAPSATRTTITI